MTGPADRPSLRFRRLLAVTPLLILLTSCASLGPDPLAAADIAVAFHAATTDDDGQAACRLLAPNTESELEDTTDESCDVAVLDQDLPDAEVVNKSQAFGRSAQVQMDGDVVFLAMFDGQWRVTAAGCTPDGEAPYDCVVKGS